MLITEQSIRYRSILRFDASIIIMQYAINIVDLTSVS